MPRPNRWKTAEEREESNEVEQGGDHRSEILPAAELPDQWFGRRMAFWQGQDRDAHAMARADQAHLDDLAVDELEPLVFPDDAGARNPLELLSCEQPA